MLGSIGLLLALQVPMPPPPVVGDFFPGPWVVYFEPDSVRYHERSDRYFVAGLDRVNRVLGRGRNQYRGCFLASTETSATSRGLAERRFRAVARIVRRYTGTTLRYDASTCDPHDRRPLPAVYVTLA